MKTGRPDAYAAAELLLAVLLTATFTACREERI